MEIDKNIPSTDLLKDLDGESSWFSFAWLGLRVF